MTDANEKQTPTENTPQKPSLRQRWRKANERRAFRWGTQAALFILIFWAIMAFQTRKLIDDESPAPAFQLQDLQGQSYALEDHQGDKVVLAFWSPFCSICALEVDTLNAIHEDPDAQVISVVLSYRNHDEIQAFINENEVRYPVLLGTKELARDYRVESYPTIYIIDEEGRVQSTMVGYTTEIGLRARLSF